MGNTNFYQNKIDQKQGLLQSQIDESKSHLENLRLTQQQKTEIINTSATELLNQMNVEKRYTSLEVLLTFYEQFLNNGLDLNIMTDNMILEAIQQAKQCDQLRNKQDFDINKHGILFGLPMSVKENFHLKNTDSTGGFAANVMKPYSQDGLFVELMKEQGAIFFIKTNIPQGLLLPESNNNIYGKCKNPYDKDRSAGGSSGGEAAIIAIKASPLGLGTDIGGSLRIPALFCGICSFKPTIKRITEKGLGYYGFKYNGQINIKATAGPMANCVNDLTLVMKVQTNQKAYENDPYLLNMPFKDQEYKTFKKLRIGYYKGDSFFPISEANKRAIDISIEALKKLGHELVEFKIPNFEELHCFYLNFMSLAGLDKIYQGAKKEKLIKEYALLVLAQKMPLFLKWIISRVYNMFNKQRMIKILNLGLKNKSYTTYYSVSQQQQQIKEEFFLSWKSQNIDALISPGLALPAFKHGQCKFLTQSCCYTFMFNIMDYPTGNIPVTKVQQDEQFYNDSLNNDNFTKQAKDCMEKSSGMPVGIQISTLPFKDELCLNVMKQLENQLQNN